MQISIVTASYNYENFIKETIESVISQTYTDWEMIIVDDGSKDNSVNVIKEYCKKDSRINLFQHENGENRGLAQTIQLALEKASGDWIVFLESDDTITKDYLEEKIKVVQENPNVGLIFNDINLFGDEERIEGFNKAYLPRMKKKLQELGTSNKLVKLFKNKGKLNFIPTFSVVMIKTELLKNLDFNSPNKPSLDFYLWLQIAKKCDYYFIDKKLTNWRMHKNSYISHSVDDKIRLDFDLLKNKYIYGKLGFFVNLSVLFKFHRRRIIRTFPKQNEVILFSKISIKNGVWTRIK